MDECLFCKMIAGEIPVEKVYEDEHVLAFKDIKPVAPHHVLVIPRKHVEALHDLVDVEAAGRLLVGAGKTAQALGLDKTGYRIAVNTGRDAHQEVPHVHIHLIGGRDLTWPPG